MIQLDLQVAAVIADILAGGRSSTRRSSPTTRSPTTRASSATTRSRSCAASTARSRGSPPPSPSAAAVPARRAVRPRPEPGRDLPRSATARRSRTLVRAPRRGGRASRAEERRQRRGAGLARAPALDRGGADAARRRRGARAPRRRRRRRAERARPRGRDGEELPEVVGDGLRQPRADHVPARAGPRRRSSRSRRAARGCSTTLRTHPGIGFVLVRSERDGAVVLGAARRARCLRAARVEGEDPLAPFGPNAADHVRARTASRTARTWSSTAPTGPRSTRSPPSRSSSARTAASAARRRTRSSCIPPSWAWPDEEVVGAEAVHRDDARLARGSSARRRSATTPPMRSLRACAWPASSSATSSSSTARARVFQTAVGDGMELRGLGIEPIDKRVTYRQCSAHDVVGHWARRGRTQADGESCGPPRRSCPSAYGARRAGYNVELRARRRARARSSCSRSPTTRTSSRSCGRSRGRRFDWDAPRVVGARRRLGRRARRRGARALPGADAERRGRPLAGRHRATAGSGACATARHDGRGWFVLRHARGRRCPRSSHGRADRARRHGCSSPLRRRPPPRSRELRLGAARRAPPAAACSSLEHGEAPAPPRAGPAPRRRRRAPAARGAVGPGRSATAFERAARAPRAQPHAAARPVGRRARSTRFLALHGVEVDGAAAPRARRAARRARRGARRRSAARARPRASRSPRSRRASAASCSRSSGRACATRSTRAARSSPTSRGSARRSGARRARGRRRVPGDRRLPRVAEAQLGARGRALAAAPHASRSSRAAARSPPTRRDHDPQLRDRRRAPRGARRACAPRALVVDESHYVKNPQAKRTQAVRRLAERRRRRTGCASR